MFLSVKMMDMTLSITIPCLLLTVLPLSNEVIKIRPIMSDMSQSPSRDPSHFGRCSYPFPKFVSASQHFGPFSYPLPKSASASQHFAPFNYPPPKFASVPCSFLVHSAIRLQHLHAWFSVAPPPRSCPSLLQGSQVPPNVVSCPFFSGGPSSVCSGQERRWI
jgi:hypothetical protein